MEREGSGRGELKRLKRKGKWGKRVIERFEGGKRRISGERNGRKDKRGMAGGIK